VPTVTVIIKCKVSSFMWHLLLITITMMLHSHALQAFEYDSSHGLSVIM